MRNITLAFFAVASFIFVDCGKPTENKKETPMATVMGFMGWYRANYDKVNAIPIVNQKEGENYTVNFEEADKYLALLKSSGYLADEFEQNFRTYFASADKNLRAEPIMEGPPPGFEFDLIIWTQEPEVVLNDSVPALVSESPADDRTTLQLSYGQVMTLDFRFVKVDGKWLIASIMPPGM